MDSNYRRRTRARRGGGPPASGGGDGGDGGGGVGREKAYSDDYNDRACAALLKYKRVAGFVLGAGGGGAEAGGTGRRAGKTAAHSDHVDVDVDVDVVAGPSPEDIVGWLDARLLDKNIPPLYRTGLRPEHALVVLETLLRGGGGGGRDVAEAARTSVAFGGLGEAIVREIVVSEASRRGGDAGGARGESADRNLEEAPAEVAEAVAAMFGEGQGQGLGQDKSQRGPWRQK